jgi:FkbM family methyltransferase
MEKSFWTLTENGSQVLRNLAEENKFFTTQKYYNGEFDSNNYQWFEMFGHFVHDDIGCDYERYGCYIRPGDVVLDIGANIGIFAHRAEQRGASKVISFEPLTPTYNCLSKNLGPKTISYKNAVGGKSNVVTFNIHTNYTHIGGGTSFLQDMKLSDKKIVHFEKVFVVGINDIFENFETKIDFMKLDVEGGEVEILSTIKNEHLSSLRCLSAEFHRTYDEFDNFQNSFTERMHSLGFTSFTLYYGDGTLRTLNFWKI